jgi:hypothetical protein
LQIPICSLVSLLLPIPKPRKSKAQPSPFVNLATPASQHRRFSFSYLNRILNAICRKSRLALGIPSTSRYLRRESRVTLSRRYIYQPSILLPTLNHTQTPTPNVVGACGKQSACCYCPPIEIPPMLILLVWQRATCSSRQLPSKETFTKHSGSSWEPSVWTHRHPFSLAWKKGCRECMSFR